MKLVDIYEAKTNLTKLVNEAANGEPFIIVKAGKPLVKVTAVEAPETGEMRRIGFLAGQIEVPDNFDRMSEVTIATLFGAA